MTAVAPDATRDVDRPGRRSCPRIAWPSSPAPTPVVPADLAARVHESTALAPLWAVRYRIALVTLDLCCIIVATVVGYELRFGVTRKKPSAISYLAIGLVIALGWIVALQLRRLRNPPPRDRPGRGETRPAGKRTHRQRAGDRLLRDEDRGRARLRRRCHSDRDRAAAHRPHARCARSSAGVGDRRMVAPNPRRRHHRVGAAICSRSPSAPSGAGLKVVGAAWRTRRAERDRTRRPGGRRGARRGGDCRRASASTSSPSPAAGWARSACANSAGARGQPDAAW